MTALKKTALAAMAALTLGAGVAATATPAAAQWHGGGWGGGWHGGYGGPVAAGVLGGLAVGAIAGSAAAGGYGYGPYGAYGGSGCGWQRQPVVDAYGNFLGYRRVQVCY
jgi:hypothetical protein